MNVDKERQKAARQAATRMAHQDSRRINAAYVNLHQALDELLMVVNKDNILAHMVRTMGAMEDTLYEYVTTKGRK